MVFLYFSKFYLKLTKINKFMYKFLIKQYEKKPFDSYFFNLTLTYYVKKSDFNTVKEIIENTNYKTKTNYHIVKIRALSDCSLYQKPIYKLFNLLFSQIPYTNPLLNFNITEEDIKKYDLYKNFENCLATNKVSFLKKLLKKYSHINLIEHTLEQCVKMHKNNFDKEYYELLLLSLEKNINLCLKNKDNNYLTCILKENSWEDI